MLIRKLRLQHGMTQERLAQITWLSVRTVQRTERGQHFGSQLPNRIRI
ncbi:helix-turn-helix domain-containing protein [Microbulbifer sp. TRSA007]